MDPVVAAALITAAGGITTALVALRQARIAEETKRTQQANATKVDSVAVRLEHWTELVDALRDEIDRKNAEIVLKDAKIEAMQETIDHLRNEHG